MANDNYPLVSYFIVSYNEEKYIKEAVQSAFDQDYPNLEIVLSDDNSSDGTFEIMKEMAASYKGPHKVVLNQNVPNLGPRDHYCKVLYELCHGEFIVFADGDDISKPNRTSISVDFMIKHPEVMSLSCESQLINEDGEEIAHRSRKRASTNQTSIYTLDDFVAFDLINLSDDSRVIRRALVDSYPPLQYSYAEDLFLFVRSLFIGSYAYLRQPLVLYRQRGDSIMGKKRKKRWASRSEIERFNNTSKKQIITDFEFAKSRGYIPPEGLDNVENRMTHYLRSISPEKKQLLNRIARRMVLFLEGHFSI